MQPPGRLKAVFQALLVTFLWSTSWVLIKYFIQEIPPLTFAGLRYVIAVIILLPGLKKHKIRLQSLSSKEWRSLAILGLVFYTITQGGQFLTLKYLDATTFSLLLNLTSVLVAVFGIFGLREIPALRQWFGMIIFVTGMFLYFSSSITTAGQPVGYIFALITVCANAAASVLGRAINRQKTIPPLVITIVSMAIGAFVLLGLGLAVEETPSLSLVNLGVILWLAAINTAFAFTLWNKSLQILSAVESSIINNTMLIQIAVLAWVFLGEKLSTLDILGLSLSSAGLLLANLKPGQAKT